MNQIKNQTFECLNHGFVRLVDIMGDDAAIVQAARTSYGQGTKTYSEDRSLIRYLMRNKHTSPFEMVELKFHVKLPIFVARQWIRHRTANVNELSGRYSQLADEFYMPNNEHIKKQNQNNKQGRATWGFNETENVEIIDILQKTQQISYENYTKFIEKGMARELARINLPVSIYTEWYWKIDLHNLFHFLKLRLDAHAQYEIRTYAETIANILRQCVPLAWEAFEDYALNAITFSASEISILRKLLLGREIDSNILEDSGLSKREIEEFLNKGKALNILPAKSNTIT